MFTRPCASLLNTAAAGAGFGRRDPLEGPLPPGGLREPRQGAAARARRTAVAHIPHPLPGETNVSLEAKEDIYIKILLMF